MLAGEHSVAENPMCGFMVLQGMHALVGCYRAHARAHDGVCTTAGVWCWEHAIDQISTVVGRNVGVCYLFPAAMRTSSALQSCPALLQEVRSILTAVRLQPIMKAAPAAARTLLRLCLGCMGRGGILAAVLVHATNHMPRCTSD